MPPHFTGETLPRTWRFSFLSCFSRKKISARNSSQGRGGGYGSGAFGRVAVTYPPRLKAENDILSPFACGTLFKCCRHVVQIFGSHAVWSFKIIPCIIKSQNRHTEYLSSVCVYFTSYL